MNMHNRSGRSCAEALSGVMRAALRRMQALRSDDRGAAAILAAVLFPIVIGGMGLGAEAGYWHLTQRKLQHAADLSAHAAAIRKRAGDADERIAAVALHIAQQAGFKPASGTILVNTPPASGASAGDGSSVEVLLSETQSLLFSSLFMTEPVTLSGRAVASVTGGSQACVLALSPTAPGAVEVAGSSEVTLDGCDVASNSNASNALYMHGSASLTTDCAHTVGGSVTTTNLVLQDEACGSVREQASVTADPYASLEMPSGCHSKEYLPDYHYHCDFLDIKKEYEFPRGLHIIGAGMTINSNAIVRARGVSFYFEPGAVLKVNGGAQLDMTASENEPYRGLLFFSSTDNTEDHQINGTSGSQISGAIYFPSSQLKYAGNAGAGGGCIQLIADKVTFTGNSEVQSVCGAGMSDIKTNQIVDLVE